MENKILIEKEIEELPFKIIKNGNSLELRAKNKITKGSGPSKAVDPNFVVKICLFKEEEIDRLYNLQKEKLKKSQSFFNKLKFIQRKIFNAYFL